MLEVPRPLPSGLEMPFSQLPSVVELAPFIAPPLGRLRFRLVVFMT